MKEEAEEKEDTFWLFERRLANYTSEQKGKPCFLFGKPLVILTVVKHENFVIATAKIISKQKY